MGFFHQLKILMWKNYVIKRRRYIITLAEIIIPLVIFLILIATRHRLPPQLFKTYRPSAQPLPSAGLIPILHSFCRSSTFDQHGYVAPETSRIQRLLENIDSVILSNDLARGRLAFNSTSNFSDMSIEDINAIINIQKPPTEKNYMLMLLKELLLSANISKPVLPENSVAKKLLDFIQQSSGSMVPAFFIFANNMELVQDLVCEDNVTFRDEVNAEWLESKRTQLCSLTPSQFNKSYAIENHFYREHGRNDSRALIHKLEHYVKFRNDVESLWQLSRKLPNNCPLYKSTARSSNTSFRNPTVSNTIMAVWQHLEESICGPQAYTKSEENEEVNNEVKPKIPDVFERVQFMLSKNPVILFAPNTSSNVREVITKTNATLNFLDEMVNLAKEWLKYSSKLKKQLTSTSFRQNVEFFKMLHRVAVRPQTPFYDLLQSQAPLINEQEILEKLQLVDNSACAWIEIMKPLNLDIWRGFPTERDAELYFENQAYRDGVTVYSMVIFNVNKDGTLPRHVTYKIRQNSTLLPTTRRDVGHFWLTPTKNDFDNSGKRYMSNGFIILQDMIERAVIEFFTGKVVSTPGVYLSVFPLPCTLKDRFTYIIEHMFPLFMTIGWVYAVAISVQNIVYEKENGLKEVMRMMGLNNAVHWTAWFLSSFFHMQIVVILVTGLLKTGGILPFSNPFIIWGFLTIFMVANIMFCFLMSVFYSKAKVAAACAGIIYFISYVPYIYVSIVEGSTTDYSPVSASVKQFVSLFSTTAFGLGAKYIAVFEIQGVGLQFENIWVSPFESDTFTIAAVANMMFLDSIIYALLAWYIEAVLPGKYGLPRPFYFPLMRSYWFPGASKQSSRKGPSIFKRFFQCCHLYRGKKYQHIDPPKFSPMCESEPPNLSLGVKVQGLSKVYSNGKIAVNNLSFNLYHGQVTSFLGHNGAGKTTTMSILTGMIPPTHGTAEVYKYDIHYEMDSIRKSLGMCPQHNALFDQMTVEEHLWFYGSLKEMHVPDLHRAINSLLRDVNMEMKRVSPVHTLSGGMKRKLSVAIAFIGNAKLVILDEPTAGIDPFARRAIWDLIIKFKKGRTILLSTHFTDEADLLGDRIAIISSGSLVCSGSSLFLKSNYGDGYKLTLVKQLSDSIDGSSTASSTLYNVSSAGDQHPRASVSSNPVSPQNESVAKAISSRIVNFIAEELPSAHLDQESHHELTFVIPTIYKQNMASFLRKLEENKSDLRIESYGVRDTTLEEVFIAATEDPSTSNNRPRVANLTENDRLSSFRNFANRMGKWYTSSMSSLGSRQISVDATKDTNRDGGDTARTVNTQISEDAVLGTRVVECPSYPPVNGALLYWRQLYALLIKRFIHARRNVKGLFSQIVLPALFVSIAMTMALYIPSFSSSPPITLDHTTYKKHTGSGGNYIPVIYNPLETIKDGYIKLSDADYKTIGETFLGPAGVGSMCTLHEWANHTQLNRVRSDHALSPLLFEEACSQEVTPRKIYIPFQDRSGINLTHLSSFESINSVISNIIRNYSQKIYTPYSCRCSGNTESCMDPALPQPFTVLTPHKDSLMYMSKRNYSDYFLASYNSFRLHRFGGFELGGIREFVPPSFSSWTPINLQTLAKRQVMKVWVSAFGFHSLPIFFNAANNAILRANIPKDKDTYGITLINHPINKTESLSLQYFKRGTDYIVALFIIIAMSFVPASFVVFLVLERASKAKHLQRLSGMSLMMYWLSNLIWDMTNYLLPATCCIAILKWFNLPAYTSSENMPIVIALFLLYGWSMTPIMYPASFIFNEPSTAYISLIVFNLFFGITATLSSVILEFYSKDDEFLEKISNFLQYIFVFFPNYNLAHTLAKLAFNQYRNEFFSQTGNAHLVRDPYTMDLAGRPLLFMACEGAVFFVITLIIEFNFFFKPKRLAVTDDPIEDEDVDVALERERVLNGESSDMIRLENLSKIYSKRKTGNILAVDRLCLGIPDGECFGLLGVNGAGKSSTFKMLTGDVSVSAGDAYFAGYSLVRDTQKVQSMVGYCPQQDALFDELTVKDHLHLHAKLRGIPASHEEDVIQSAIETLALVPFIDKLAGTLSGGNKRKLSTAIALIGNPKIIFMDEPTSGMDPKARRFLWETIRGVIRSGRSVILTSHSMEECEALCGRMVIMVNGHFKCIGSIQHLKNRFGDGYIITARVTGGIKQLRILNRLLQQFLPSGLLIDYHHHQLQYQMASEDIPSVAHLFEVMEDIASEICVSDYSISQTNLESVFINFAKDQTDEETLILTVPLHQHKRIPSGFSISSQEDVELRVHHVRDMSNISGVRGHSREPSTVSNKQMRGVIVHDSKC